jgi:hypothetical protein
VEAGQPGGNIDGAVATTGPVPIDEHHPLPHETEIITPDIAVHQRLTCQLDADFCRHEGGDGVG